MSTLEVDLRDGITTPPKILELLYLMHARRLVVRNVYTVTRTGDAVLRALLRSGVVSELDELAFVRAGVRLDLLLATELASSSLLAGLRLLEMPCEEWPYEMPEMHAPQLETLGIAGASSSSVLRAFFGCSKLRSLDVSGAGIAGPAIARLVADGTVLPALTEANLSRSKLVDSSALALASSSRTFEKLDLSYNDFTTDGVLALANSPSIATASVLDLRHNTTPISDAIRQRLRERMGERVLLGEVRGD